MVLGSIHERSLENIAQIKFVCIQLIIYLIQEMALVCICLFQMKFLVSFSKENERHVDSYFTLVAYFQQVVMVMWFDICINCENMQYCKVL